MLQIFTAFGFLPVILLLHNQGLCVVSAGTPHAAPSMRLAAYSHGFVIKAVQGPSRISVAAAS